MSDHTIKLAALGARVMAIWGFGSELPGADTVEAVNEAIHAVGLDFEDNNQVRTICAEHDLDAREYGDEAPELIAAEVRPALDLTTVQNLHNEFEDARAGNSNDREIAAATDLIHVLLPLAGIAYAPTVGTAL